MRLSLLPTLSTVGIFSMLSIASHAALPAITGKPTLDVPPLLAWPHDRGDVEPNLNDPTSNVLFDLHGDIDRCDMMFSSEGNYHPALQDVWPLFLARFKDKPLVNAFYTTSSPMFVPQIQNGVVQIGNVYAKCRPQLVAASDDALKKLQAAGLAEGEPIPLYQDRGVVILVKKGNPKKIRGVWDLARADVRYVTPNPTHEPGAFKRYLENLHGIAANDPNKPAGMTADKLIEAIFNQPQATAKWLTGARIHHRDVPWSIAHGRADAGVIIYHLGRVSQQTFPDRFEIVPLGGTADDPKPLPGTKTGVRSLLRVKGEWTPRQRDATEALIETLGSPEFSAILARRGLARPAQ